MTVARLFALQAAVAAGVAVIAFIVGQSAWCAGGLAGASVALILWGMAKAIEETDDRPSNVIWRTTPPFGVERVITPAPITTELTYRPARARTVIPGGPMPHWAHDNHPRPVWDTDIFGAPE